MTIVEAVRARLLDMTPVTTLVNERVFTVQFPQKVTRPAALVQQISEVQPTHLRGAGGLLRARVQVDCIGSSIRDARALDQAVLGRFQAGAPTGLRGFTGPVGGSPGLTIASCFSDSLREWFEGEELREYRVTRDYLIQFYES